MFDFFFFLAISCFVDLVTIGGHVGGHVDVCGFQFSPMQEDALYRCCFVIIPILRCG